MLARTRCSQVPSLAPVMSASISLPCENLHLSTKKIFMSAEACHYNVLHVPTDIHVPILA